MLALRMYSLIGKKGLRLDGLMGSRYDGNNMQFGFGCCWIRLGDKIRTDLKGVEYGIKSDVVGDLGAAVAWKKQKT